MARLFRARLARKSAVARAFRHGEALRQGLIGGPVALLLDALSGPGQAPARIVGGAVRNAVLGVPIHDFDIATPILPQGVIARARALRWKVVPTGIAHGTVTVIIDGVPFEVTTLREDIATDGRHADVRFGHSFERDAARRDFTINAMSMGLDGRLHDYFGGVADLAAGRVRFIGDAAARLNEDYLRGLRFLRFSASYGAERLDAEGLAAVDAARAGFARLSRERIRQEFIKLVLAPRAIAVMQQAQERGLVAEILGLPVDVLRLAGRIAAGEAGVVARLSALCLRGPGDVAVLRESLKLSNREQLCLEKIAAALTAFAGEAPSRLRAMAAQFPEVAQEVVEQLALTAGAEFRQEALACIAPLPRFHLTGKDVLARGHAPGPGLGAILNRARELWLARGCDSERAAQLALLDEVTR